MGLPFLLQIIGLIQIISGMMNFNTTSLPGEIWKDVPSLDNLYAISNYGRMKAYARSGISSDGKFYTKKEHLVSLKPRKNGYVEFRPTVDGVLLNVKIHRLVAEAFIPNPLELPDVNHKDENPSNNHVDNLEWCTPKYNSNYGTCQARHSKTLKAVLREKIHSICQYSMEGKLLHTYKGKAEIEEAGFVYTTITRCCRHQNNSSQGYIWRYDNDEYAPKPEKKIAHNGIRTVLCYDLAMHLVAEYPSVTEAANSVGGNSGSICRCCRGGRPTAYGYIWRYKNLDYSNKKKVNCYDLDMKYVRTYNSISEAAKEVGGKGPVITLCCTGTNKSAYGFKWRYADT